MTVGCWVGNVDITLQRNRCVPFNRPIPDGFVVKQVQVLSKVRGALLNQGIKKISLESRSFVNTGAYDWDI